MKLVVILGVLALAGCARCKVTAIRVTQSDGACTSETCSATLGDGTRVIYSYTEKETK